MDTIKQQQDLDAARKKLRDQRTHYHSVANIKSDRIAAKSKVTYQKVKAFHIALTICTVLFYLCIGNYSDNLCAYFFAALLIIFMYLAIDSIVHLYYMREFDKIDAICRDKIAISLASYRAQVNAIRNGELK